MLQAVQAALTVVKVLCFALYIDKKPYMCPAQMHQILILAADRKQLLSKGVTALGISASHISHTETSENQHFKTEDRLKIEELAQHSLHSLCILCAKRISLSSGSAPAYQLLSTLNFSSVFLMEILKH